MMHSVGGSEIFVEQWHELQIIVNRDLHSLRGYSTPSAKERFVVRIPPKTAGNCQDALHGRMIG